jgi:hypothetical protein
MAKRRTQKGQPRKPRGDAVANTNNELLEAVNRIHAMVVEAETRDVKQRYEIATACRELRDTYGYGEQGVKALAARLKWHPSTVHAYANVATVWSPDKFAKEAEKHDASGKPLAWSIFVELTSEGNGNRRRSLLSRARRECWTVPQLRAARDAKSSATADQADDTGEPKSERQSGLAVAREPVAKQLAALTSLMVQSDKRWDRKVAKASADDLHIERDAWQSIREDAAKFYEWVDGRFSQIEQQLELDAEAP